MADIIAGIAPQVDTHANWTALNPTLGKDSGGKSYGQILISTGSPVGDLLIWGNDESYNTAFAAGQYSILGAPVSEGNYVVGEYRQVGGNIREPSADFPAVCVTDIADDEVKTVTQTLYPDLVEWARAQKLIYMEGQTGEVEDYSGSAAASVITLDDNDANNAVLSALYEDALAHGGGLEVASYTNWLSVTWDGTEYVITAINTTARTITVTGTPTAGAGNASFHPHRIPASATTARLFSMQGRSLTGAGMSSLFSGLRRRDQMQRITGDAYKANFFFNDLSVNGAFYTKNPTGQGTTGASGTGATFAFDSSLSPDARTSAETDTPKATHGPDSGIHLYIHAGRYLE